MSLSVCFTCSFFSYLCLSVTYCLFYTVSERGCQCVWLYFCVYISMSIGVSPYVASLCLRCFYVFGCVGVAVCLYVCAVSVCVHHFCLVCMYQSVCVSLILCICLCRTVSVRLSSYVFLCVAVCVCLSL